MFYLILFSSIFTSDRYLYFFLLPFLSLRVTVKLLSLNKSNSFFFFLFLLSGTASAKGGSYLYKYFVVLNCRAIWAHSFGGRGEKLAVILISLLMTGLFDFSFYSLSILVFLIFPESYPIHPIVQICECFIILVHNTILLFFKSVVSVTLFSLPVLLHLFFFFSVLSEVCLFY